MFGYNYATDVQRRHHNNEGQRTIKSGILKKHAKYLNDKYCKEIPAEFKCSRCKEDMRRPLSDDGGCKCSNQHPITPSKSGNAIYKTDIDYNGKMEY